ncbi:MAG: hypothetical protein ACNYPE_05825 [Candidatus Azotimanducaceae bacterium WSBS_2022_MAG_OTU7]
MPAAVFLDAHQLVPVQKLPKSTEKRKPEKVSLLFQALTRELMPAAVFLDVSAGSPVR